MNALFISAFIGLWFILSFMLISLSDVYELISVIGIVLIAGNVAYFIVKTSIGALPRKLISDIEQKVVFITGCDTGFGHTLAINLDKLGFKVFAGCLSPNGTDAKQLREEASDRLEIVEIDVTNDRIVKEAYEYVKKEVEGMKDGRLWALVNNAGIAIITEIELCPVAVYQQVLDVNALGPLRVTKAFLPLLRKHEGNRIIIVASLAGRYTFPGFSAYSMSKHAAVSFADALRLEMKKWNISVHTVEPTLYKTSIADEKRIQKNLDNFWEETPAYIKKSYGQAYLKDFKETISTSLKKAKPEGKIREVIEDLVDAVAGKYPQSRYVPSFATQLRVRFLSSLPIEVLDNLMTKSTPSTPPADLEEAKKTRFIF